MNEGELILAYTYDDIYIELRKLIIHHNLDKFIETFDYVLSLDPNVFQNYPIFTRFLIQIVDYSDEIEYLEIIKYLLDNGLDLNQIHTNPYNTNYIHENITIFNKIIYRMCKDLDHMWVHRDDDLKIEIKYFTNVLKIFFNHSHILPNKGSPTLYEILDMFPNIKFIMIQILDDASFDIETFKSKSRLAFAKSGLAPSIIDSILHHADIDTIDYTGQNIHPNKYESKNKTFNKYDPLETFEEYLVKKGGKSSKKVVNTKIIKNVVNTKIIKNLHLKKFENIKYFKVIQYILIIENENQCYYVSC